MALINALILSIMMLMCMIGIWMAVRRCRGDKQQLSLKEDIDHHGSIVSEVHFDENFQPTANDLVLGSPSRKFSKRVPVKNSESSSKSPLISALKKPSPSTYGMQNK
jgi:hypothetical protein